MEGQRGVLQRADQQVLQQRPVGQVRLGDGLAAAPAADQVHQAVDPAELGQHPGGPVLGGLLVEQVHHGGVHVATVRGSGVALRDDRLEPLGAGVGGHDRGAGGGEPGHQRRPRGAGRPGHDDHPAGDRAGHRARRTHAVIPEVAAMTSASFLRSAS